MQLLIKIENGAPTGAPIIADNLRLVVEGLPDRFLLADDLQATGYAGLMPTAQPENRNPTKRVIEAVPTEQNSDGEWLQVWEIVDRDDLTESEREELLTEFAASEKSRVERELTDAVQIHMDTRARQERYDDIRSAITYATSTHPKFGPEGMAFRDWRDDVWERCYQVLADVEAGNREIPTPEELIAELPALVLPTATDGGANV